MMKNTFAALLLSALCTVAVAQTSAAQQLKAGIDAYSKQGDKGLARQSFLKAVELNKDYAAPKFNLAQLAEEEERWAEAVKWYAEYLKLDKTSSYADIAERKIASIKKYIEADKTPEGKKERIYLQYVQKAQAQLAGGNVGASIAYSELALAYHPARFEAYLMYAVALMETERYAEAIVKLNLAGQYAAGAVKTEIAGLIAKSNEGLDQQAKIRTADRLFEQKNYAAAAAGYSEIWTFLDQSEFGFLAAKSWAMARQEDKAIKIYERLARAKNLRVAAKAKQEKSDLESGVAVPSDRKSSPVSKESVANSVEFAQANKLLANKKYYEADSQLTQVLDGLLPASEYAVMFDARGVARNGLKEYQSAIQDLTLALILDPRMIGALLHRAESHAGINQFSEAAKDVDRAIELSVGEAAKDNLRKIKKNYLSRLEAK